MFQRIMSQRSNLIFYEIIYAWLAQYSKFKYFVRNPYIVMFDIVFSVKAEVAPTEVIKVVGCISELGSWNPHNAPSLIFKRGSWEGVKIKVEYDKKFQFKLVKVKQNGNVQWEELPNNSNRKFKPKCHSKLQLVWSFPQGTISALTRNSIKLNGLPAAIRVESKAASTKTSKRSNEEFDPYRNAHDDRDTDSEQEQDFTLIKRKMSDQITINTSDLEQIYYNSCPIEIFWDLLKKLKLYVISSQIDVNSPFLQYVEQQLKQLPTTCMVKWITSDCLLCNDKRSSHRKIKKRNSIFDIKQEELHIQSLYSRTSYFMFLEIETAIKFKGKIGHVPACLFLPASKYQEIIDILPFMSHIQLVCFDQPSANRAYFEYLSGNEGSSSGFESQKTIKLSIANPSIYEIIEALKELKYRDTIIVNTLGNIMQHDALKLIENQNTITIIDSHLAENYPKFMEKIIDRLHHYSLLVIVAQTELHQQILDYSLHKNVVIVHSNFQKIILQGKEYHPLRGCKETIGFLMMKLRLYQQNYGGQINQKIGSLTFSLPEGKQEAAARIQNQFKSLVSKYSFIKISLKGVRIKITWNLAIEARILRTICQIKYTNFGVLGNFNIISDRLSLRQLKDALRLLIQHCPKLFLAKHDTKVRYFSYGSGQAATCHILPESTEEESKMDLHR